MLILNHNVAVSLTDSYQPTAAPCRNIVVHGTEATGKSAVTEALLQKRSGPGDDTQPDQGDLLYAIVNSVECITGRHLLETTVGKVAEALDWPTRPSRCENLSQLTVELSKMLLSSPASHSNLRFVLVFDAIDRQREPPHTLLPALARLSEVIPSLTTVFIVTSPPSSFLRLSSAPHVHFPNYTKSEFVTILNKTPPSPLPNSKPEETLHLWERFTSAVHDALTRSASRTLPSFRHACSALWPRFTAPIVAGTHTPKEFSKLMVATRVHFQDERLLDPGIIAVPAETKNGPVAPQSSDLTSLLPTTARLLLLAAYLASHNTPRHDLTLFSTHHHGRRRKRGGLSVSTPSRRHGHGKMAHRKIARKLLGAHAFVLERMMAIFAAVRREWEDGWEGDEVAGGDADVAMAIATLASLRLLVRIGGAGGGDVLDRGGKWRVNVGWETVRGMGRSMGVEVEEWLVDY
ncbi:hypothetical protein DL546_006231 [Coniochaeta pulveracea]|uniref:Uncharacterized protein n=1 Tax=Coniochaeta pulveracea TaxID=177199 RepID=A0A420Y661_9PEZI|nr:hypothetical protein DL546_006231 [Coniochaeta pulveracea]